MAFVRVDSGTLRSHKKVIADIVEEERDAGVAKNLGGTQNSIREPNKVE